MSLSFIEKMIVLGIIIITIPGFVFQKSKAVFIFEYSVLTLLIAFYDSMESDLFFYSHEYDAKRLSASIFEKGYEFLGILFKNVGFSFEVFHIVVALLSMIAFAYVILHLSKRPAFCASLMFGFATFEYAWQLKSLTASAIVVCAAYYFFGDIYNIKRQIIYIVLVIITSEFHFSSVLFLPIVLIACKNFRVVKRVVLVGLLMVIILFIPLTAYARTLIPAFATYLNPLSIKTIVISMAWHVAGIFIMGLMYSKVRKMQKSQCFGGIDKLSIQESELIRNIYLGSVCLLLALPLYYFTNVTSRIIRTWCIFYIIGVSCVKKRWRFLNKENVIQYSMIGYIIMSFIAYYVLFTHNKLLVKNFIEGNFLLRILL